QDGHFLDADLRVTASTRIGALPPSSRQIPAPSCWRTRTAGRGAYAIDHRNGTARYLVAALQVERTNLPARSYAGARWLDVQSAAACGPLSTTAKVEDGLWRTLEGRIGEMCELLHTRTPGIASQYVFSCCLRGEQHEQSVTAAAAHRNQIWHCSFSGLCS